jgi:hypothetical protein
VKVIRNGDVNADLKPRDEFFHRDYLIYFGIFPIKFSTICSKIPLQNFKIFQDTQSRAIRNDTQTN